MITLYHCASSRSFRALWALEALELEYDLKILPPAPRFSVPGYLDLNPMGTVPLLIDEDVRMTESVAICEYLSQRHGGGRLSLAPAEPDYGRFLNLCLYGEATLTFPLTLVMRYRHLEPENKRNPQIVADYERWFLARLNKGRELDGAGEFLCGQRLTNADISVGFALGMARGLGLEDRLPADALRYHDRLQTLACYQRARAREGDTPPLSA